MNDDQFKTFMNDVANILNIEIKGNRDLSIWKSEFGHFEFEVANRMVDLCYAEEERSRKSMALLKKYQSRALAHHRSHTNRLEAPEEEYHHIQENCDWCGSKGFITVMDTNLPYEDTRRCLCNNGKQYLYFPKIEMGRLEGLKRQYANRYFNEKWYTPLKKSEFREVYNLAKSFIGNLDHLKRVVGEMESI